MDVVNKDVLLSVGAWKYFPFTILRFLSLADFVPIKGEQGAICLKLQKN